MYKEINEHSRILKKLFVSFKNEIWYKIANLRYK